VRRGISQERTNGEIVEQFVFSSKPMISLLVLGRSHVAIEKFEPDM
jgi:hypothetical protein